MKVLSFSKSSFVRLNLLAASLGLAFAVACQAQGSLDEIIQEIDQLIANDQLNAARDKLSLARSLDWRDERLDILEGRLKLFDNLELPPLSATIAAQPNATTDPAPEPDSRYDERIIVTDLLDSLKVALENGELEKVRQLSESSEQTDALLNAIFNNYANVTTQVSEAVLDEESQNYFATLEFLQLKTFDGDIAYPADNWNLHELRISRSTGEWQKIIW